jgi:hypothetical protein
MKSVVAVRLFACTTLLTTLGAFAGTGQPPGVVSHYAGMFGGSAYGPHYTPSLAYANSSQATRNLAVTVKDLTGTPAVQACKGFRRVGDCVAAAHASKNLGVSFASFRENMTGKHGQELVAAIGSLRPDVDPSLEAAKAVQQTRDDVTRT